MYSLDKGVLSTAFPINKDEYENDGDEGDTDDRRDNAVPEIERGFLFLGGVSLRVGRLERGLGLRGGSVGDGGRLGGGRGLGGDNGGWLGCRGGRGRFLRAHGRGEGDEEEQTELHGDG